MDVLLITYKHKTVIRVAKIHWEGRMSQNFDIIWSLVFGLLDVEVWTFKQFFLKNHKS